MPVSPQDLPNAPTGTRALVAPEFAEALTSIPAFEMSEQALPAVRQAVSALGQIPLPEGAAQVTVEERWIGGPDGDQLRLVLFRPAAGCADSGPAVLQIHGGGYVVGTPEMSQALDRRYASDLGCLVVSVDYRLAPEAPYPAAMQDCYAALAWMHEQAAQLGIDRRAVAIAGSSAGAGHAAALAIHARNEGRYPICLQVLDQPMLDDRTGSGFDPDPHPFCGEFGHTPVSNRFGWRALLGVEPGGPDVPEQAVPARVRDLRGLPPAFISVGGIDLFLEEAIEYARRLLRAGVAAELHVFPGGFHGWEMANAAPQTLMLGELRKSALQRAFAAATRAVT
jgi:acetyl esterase/lipase